MTLFEVDRDRLKLGMAALALVATATAGAIEAVVGVGLVQVAVAAVLVVVSGGKGRLGSRLMRMLVVTLVGGAFGFLSYIGAETAWQAAVVLAVVSYLTGLAYAFGHAVGTVGYLLLLWSAAVLIGEAHGGDPSGTAVAFLVGGLAAMVVVAATVGLRSLGRAGGDAAAPVEGKSAGPRPGIVEVVSSAIGLWSAVRALLVAVAVLIGYQLIGDLDPFWVAIVLLIVFLPDASQTLFKAQQRGIGTIAGAATSALLLAATSSEPLLVTVMLVATFGAVAFYTANYLIYAFFLTNAVLIYYQMEVGLGETAIGLRLLATIIGIGLAFVGTWVVAWSSRAFRRGSRNVGPQGLEP